MYNWGSTECSALAAIRGKACARGDLLWRHFILKSTSKGSFLLNYWQTEAPNTWTWASWLWALFQFWSSCGRVVYMHTDKANYLYSCINDKAIFLCLNDYFLFKIVLGVAGFYSKVGQFQTRENIVPIGDFTQHLNPHCPLFFIYFFYTIYHLNIQQQMFPGWIGWGHQRDRAR